MPQNEEEDALYGAISTLSEALTTSTDQLIHVAPPMTTKIFSSWEDFNVYLDEYQRQTFQVYVNLSSLSVANRNQKRLDNNKQDNLTVVDDRQMPLELKYYAKTLICTYGGKPRSRSKGIRPRQNYRPKECPARMNVLLKRRPGNCDFSKPSGWRIVVTQHRAVHNHPLNEESFLVHPRNRKVENPMVLEAVSALRKAGVTQGVIRNYISEKEPSKNVTRSDVNNLLAKLKSNNFVVPPPSTTTSSVSHVTSSPTELNGRIETEQPLDQPSTPERGGADDAENALEHDSIMEEDDGDPTERPCEDSALGFSRDGSGVGGVNDGTPAECPREDQSLGFSGDGSGEGGVTQHDKTKPSSQGFHEITTANFRLRVRDRQNNRVSGDNRDTRDHNWTIHTNSGQGLCDHGIVNTDSFQDQTSRLEGRNVALCAQNATLMEQNRQYVADLEEARERSTRQSTMLTGLRKSNANLVKAMGEQSQEIARLTKAMQDQSREIAHMKAENARLTQIHTSNGPSNNGETQTFNRDADYLETDILTANEEK